MTLNISNKSEIIPSMLVTQFIDSFILNSFMSSCLTPFSNIPANNLKPKPTFFQKIGKDFFIKRIKNISYFFNLFANVAATSHFTTPVYSISIKV